MKRTMTKIMFGSMAIILLFTFHPSVQARSFRTGMLPNGNVFSCDACHISPGGPRNDFGLDIEKLVTSGGREVFWSEALAKMDSDKDGAPNGVELGDPDGVWKEGDANPGDSSSITNPGDPDSVSDIGPVSPGDAWIAFLSGNNVAPPIDVKSRGSAIFKLHEPEKILMYYLNVFEIQDITAAHIHIGAIDVNGGVVHPLDAPLDGFSSGSLDLTEEDITNMKAGLFYVQVHTQANPAGEIRGQIEDEPLLFSAKLDGGQVVGGAVQSAGSGSMEIILNEDLNRISYTLSIMNLEGVTMAHIHEGARGVNGGVIIPLAGESFETISGEAEIDEDILSQMLKEGLYVNVHTEQNPGGEIRGQIILNAFMDHESHVMDWTMYE